MRTHARAQGMQHVISCLGRIRAAATCLLVGDGQGLCRRVQECHCMLFLTEDNDFRGEDNKIALDEVVEATKGLSGVQG